MSMLNWVRTARREYDPGRIYEGLGVVTQTRFGALMKLLEDNKFCALLTAETPNILVVGPGGDSELGYMPYELYELTGYLGYHGVDYTLTILDIKPEVVKKVLERRHVGVSVWDLSVDQTTELFHTFSWPTYCRYVDYSPHPYSYTEVYWAPIPESLEKKLSKGEVRVEVADIAQVKLPKRIYDLVICRNVLYQLDDVGRRIAFFRLARSMNANGILWMNYGMELAPPYVTYDLQQTLLNQGWFKDLRLEEGPALIEVNGFPSEFTFIKSPN